MFLAFVMHLLLKVFVATEASRRLNEDRRSGALELLLVSPLSISQIISAQTAALRQITPTTRVTMRSPTRSGRSRSENCLLSMS